MSNITPINQNNNTPQLNNYLMQQKLNMQNKNLSINESEPLNDISLNQNANFLADPKLSNMNLTNLDLTNNPNFPNASDLKNSLGSPSSNMNFIQRNALAQNQNAQYLQNIEQLKRLQAMAPQANAQQQQLLKLQQLKLIQQIQAQKNGQLFLSQQRDLNPNDPNVLQFNSLNTNNKLSISADPSGNFVNSQNGINSQIINDQKMKSPAFNNSAANGKQNKSAQPNELLSNRNLNFMSPASSQKDKPMSEIIPIPPTRVFSVIINNHKVDLTMQQVIAMRSAAQQKGDQNTLDQVNNIAKNFILQVQSILSKELELNSLKSPKNKNANSDNSVFKNDLNRNPSNSNSAFELNSLQNIPDNNNINSNLKLSTIQSGSSINISPSQNFNQNLINNQAPTTPFNKTPYASSTNNNSNATNKDIPNISSSGPITINSSTTPNRKGANNSNRPQPLNFNENESLNNVVAASINNNSNVGSNNNTSNASIDKNNSGITTNPSTNSRSGISASDATNLIKEIEQKILNFHVKRAPIHNIPDEDQLKIRHIIPILARMFFQVERVLPIVYMSSKNENTIVQVLSMKSLFEDQLAACKKAIEARNHLEKLKQINFSNISNESDVTKLKLSAQKSIVEIKNEFLLDWTELDSMRTKLISLINDVKSNINNKPTSTNTSQKISQSPIKQNKPNKKTPISVPDSPKPNSAHSSTAQLTGNSSNTPVSLQSSLPKTKKVSIDSSSKIIDIHPSAPGTIAQKRTLSNKAGDNSSEDSSESSDDDIPLFKKQALLTKSKAKSSGAKQKGNKKAANASSKLPSSVTPTQTTTALLDQPLPANVPLAQIVESNQPTSDQKDHLATKAAKNIDHSQTKSSISKNTSSNQPSTGTKIKKSESIISIDATDSSKSSVNNTPNLSTTKLADDSNTPLSLNATNKILNGKPPSKGDSQLSKIYEIYNKSSSLLTNDIDKKSTLSSSISNTQATPLSTKTTVTEPLKPPTYKDPEFDTYWQENKKNNPLEYLQQIQEKFTSAVSDRFGNSNSGNLNSCFENFFIDKDFNSKVLGPNWCGSDFKFSNSVFSIPF
ncbi:hypothetical protein AYI69_g4558 [Smittium culicis]|uniref:Uncharacterized protein n=1 Tax=Smittium culicis TaxID=133412 RepID=A0A1R1YCI4_9FUNG|nr:hypothetical protein AYI69_g4558 [Smittium culicis]